MSEVTAVIRPARQADAAAIAKVHVETWRATYAGLVPDAYLVGMSEAGQASVWRKALARRSVGERVLVAELPATTRSGAQASRVVGFGNCGRLRGLDLPYKGEIFTLYVAGDWQGRGLGRRLLAGLFRSLLAAGMPSAMLWVLSNNPSRFFYEAMAGQRVAERRESFAGTLLDETAYAWRDLASWLRRQASDNQRS